MIRVTVGSAQAGALAGLQSSSSTLAGLQEKLSSGKQITKPSDDPAGTVRAAELRGDLKRNAQYMRSSADATGWLTVADTAYGQITDLMQKVRTLTVQASNTGASTGDSAKAIANEISSIKEAILKLANTSYNGQPVFGGTTIYGQGGPEGPFELSDPDDPTSAVLYKGDTGTVSRTIGNKNTVQISQTGADVFGADGNNVFDLMDKIVANLNKDPDLGGGTPVNKTSGDPNELSDPLKSLDTAINKLTAQRAQSGAALARVTAAQATQATDKVSLKANLSQIQDIDLAEVAVQVSTAQVVYQAALQTTANIQQLSLLNFLK